MATYNAYVVTDPDYLPSGPVPNANGAVLADGSVTTYYYRTSGGTRASTTSLASVPAGAVIERIVTQ